MKMNKFSIVAVVALGGLIACGSLARAEDTKDSKTDSKPASGQRPERGAMMKERLDKMAEELKLTDDQKSKVEAAMKEQGEKMQKLRDLPQDERREKGKALREEMAKKMKEILTAEQYEKWQKMRDQRGPGGPGGPRRGGPDGEKKPEGEKKPDSDKK